MRLLRYVQPPATAGSGTTTLPAMFFPFKLVSLSASVAFGGIAGVGDFILTHIAAEPGSIISAFQFKSAGDTTSARVTFCAAGGQIIATSLPSRDVCPIPNEFWVMPGESLTLQYTEAQATDVQAPLVWSLLIP